MQASEEVFYMKLKIEIKQLKAKDEEHERLRKDVEETCDLIRTKERVSKWRILNWLERALKGGD